MELSVAFLGTGGTVPSALRSTASILLTRGGQRIMVDCGEGTQRQLRLSTGLVQVDEIYLTHLHLDHCLGLPGLLKTYDLNERSEPLTIHGPGGTARFYETVTDITGRIGYPVEVVELGEGDAVTGEGFAMEAFPVEHRTRALGYALVEDGRPGRLDPEEAARLGVTSGPDLGALQRGETVQGASGPVSPEQVLGDAREGRRVVVTGDTAPCQATLMAAADADLLIHDSSFTSDDVDRARETAHSTATDAAEIARDANARMLALVHISARYHVREVLEEARSVFRDTVAPRDFDLIEIPFRERGEPELVEGGARRHQGDPAG
jgi:ribonuclease Z